MQVESVGEQLFFTTMRIDTIGANGAHGSGTGFFFNHLSGENGYLFIVTNKHVVTGAVSGHLTFIKAADEKPVLGDGFRLEIGAQDWSQIWFGHPDPAVDIAVCAVVPLLNHVKDSYGVDLFFRALDSGSIPSHEQLLELDAVEEVNFIGYPNGVWDSKNLLPVYRTGTTASPIQVDFEGTPRFVIDASVFGGSSGSPVFIWNKGMFTNRMGGVSMGAGRFFFVGVVAAVFFRTQLNQIISVPIPTQTQPMAQQQEMIDLGIVFKAHTVTATTRAFLQARGIDPDEGGAAPVQGNATHP